MWQHVQLSEQLRPGDTLACFWDVKPPTNNNNNNISFCQLRLWFIAYLQATTLVNEANSTIRQLTLPFSSPSPAFHNPFSPYPSPQTRGSVGVFISKWTGQPFSPFWRRYNPYLLGWPVNTELLPEGWWLLFAGCLREDTALGSRLSCC